MDESVKEVLFIDASVSDPDALALMARPGVEVIQLDPTGDEWQQMGDALQGRHGIKAAHVVSHGGPGVLQLGRQRLDREALGQMDLAAFENIRTALDPQGEVLLYGCEVASGSDGMRFLKMLSDRLGTVVTASVNKTGSSSLGGDWVLEASTGQAHISPAFEDGTVYDHTLPVPRVEVYQSSLWVRPGEASYTWTIGPYTNVNGTAQPTGVSYGNVPVFDWYLNRGVFQYSTNNGSSWNNMTVNNDTNLVYYNISGSIFRFLDQSPLDTATDHVGHYLQAPAPIYGVGGSGTLINADMPPTDISSDVTILLDDTLTGATVATLTPTDTGLTLGGHWVIDSQSVPNLFTIQYNNTVGNTATLSLGTGTIPAGGTNVTVTVRYYDPYDTDSSGVAIPGDGFSKLISFEVVANATQDLNFNNESVVNTYTTDSQSNPSVATLSNGNYVVVWDSLGEGKIDNSHGAIYGRIYNNLGVAQGSPFVISNASATSNEQVPTVIALNDGRFAVAYMFQNANGTDYDVGMRLVESNGTVGSQIKINTVTANFYKPAFTTLNDGSIQVVYSDLNTGDLYGQHLAAADGVKIGGEESIAAGEAYLSGVAPLDNGGYVMSWIDYSTGKAKFKISTESAVVNTGIDTAFFNAPILVPDVGGFLLVTDEYDSGAGLTRIKAVRYSNTGTIVGTATIVNAGTEGNHYAPSVARLSGGGFIMAWQTDTDDL
ncbi:MAG: DUF4347 domain-containing protein, partial [Prosthecobacter sp.]|nr:DUF4347 domain-containing protein [Prosthecobacter sp.]